jgi:SPP1 family phage portal protein
LNEGTWNLAEGYPKENGIDKIPIIYGKQPEVEWGDVQDMINRLEKLLSNFADTNDYHGSPKILVKGEVEGFSQKGETGAIIEVSENGDAKYLEWEKAPESIKLEIQTLLNLIYTITQTPDISFDSVKGLGTISGIALKLMFMDAHLKVADHQEVLDEYLQRRINIIKAYLKLMNTKWSKEIDNLSIEPIITPYMIDATSDKIDMLVNATGGKPVISQKAVQNWQTSLIIGRRL